MTRSASRTGQHQVVVRQRFLCRPEDGRRQENRTGGGWE